MDVLFHFHWVSVHLHLASISIILDKRKLSWAVPCYYFSLLKAIQLRLTQKNQPLRVWIFAAKVIIYIAYTSLQVHVIWNMFYEQHVGHARYHPCQQLHMFLAASCISFLNFVRYAICDSSFSMVLTIITQPAKLLTGNSTTWPKTISKSTRSTHRFNLLVSSRPDNWGIRNCIRHFRVTLTLSIHPSTCLQVIHGHSSQW